MKVDEIEIIRKIVAEIVNDMMSLILNASFDRKPIKSPVTIIKVNAKFKILPILRMLKLSIDRL